MTNVSNILAIGRLAACRRMPYLQSALLSMVPVETPGLGTVASTADLLFLYDPKTIEEWAAKSDAFIAFAWAHEIMHCILNHVGRCGTRDPRLFNVACDLWINAQLLEAGFVMPEGGLLPKNFGFADNLSPDEYYALLLKEKDEREGEGKGGGSAKGESDSPGGNSGSSESGEPGEDSKSGGGGKGSEDDSGLPSKPTLGGGWCGSCAGHAVPNEPKGEEAGELGARSEADAENVRRITAEAVKSAASSGRGFVPGGMKRWAEETLGTPKVAWQTLLARATRNAIAYRPGAVDYRYSRMSRRQAAVGYGPGRPVLPALVAPVPQVALVLDTSGSMGTAEVKAALTEASGVMRAVGADIQFCACDARVHELKKVRSPKELHALVKGGGGTDFRPAFDALKKQKTRPEVVVFATDGCGPAPTTKPAGMEVIWLLIGSYKRPPCEWGTVIEID